jgi:hypothetical protein
MATRCFDRGLRLWNGLGIGFVFNFVVFLFGRGFGDQPYRYCSQLNEHSQCLMVLPVVRSFAGTWGGGIGILRARAISNSMRAVWIPHMRRMRRRAATMVSTNAVFTSCGLELEHQRCGEVVEPALRFGFENDCARDERRGIGSIGSDLTLGCHDSQG